MTSGPKGVILVEGPSDQVAIETLARKRGRDLASEAVTVVAMGGVTNLGRHLDRYAGTSVRVTGMCDLSEVPYVVSRLRNAGLGDPETQGDLEAIGFWVCTVDLEDELVRALGPERVLAVFEADGRLHKFRSFQNQPDKRDPATRVSTVGLPDQLEDPLRRAVRGSSRSRPSPSPAERCTRLDPYLNMKRPSAPLRVRSVW